MQKLTARERRHKKLLNRIARLTLERNKGIKAIVAAETQLPGLERQLRRFDLPVKPKKKVKPKAADIAPEANFEAVASAMAEEGDREAKMKALGFRKTKRKGMQPSV